MTVSEEVHHAARSVNTTMLWWVSAVTIPVGGILLPLALNQAGWYYWLLAIPVFVVGIIFSKQLRGTAQRPNLALWLFALNWAGFWLAAALVLYIVAMPLIFLIAARSGT